VDNKKQQSKIGVRVF